MRKAENEIIGNESVVKRFLAKIGPSSSNGCQIWMAAKDAAGYGRFFIGENMIFAHRVSFILVNGSIPDGMVIMHLCNNPSCVNPDHLRCGTQLENIQQREQQNRGKRFYGEENKRSKLKNTDILNIRKMGMDGVSSSIIALHFGINARSARRIIAKQRWAHIL